MKRRFVLDENLRCVARTRTGRRCRNTVFEGQWWDADGKVAVEDVVKALEQRCRVHRGETLANDTRVI